MRRRSGQVSSAVSPVQDRDAINFALSAPGYEAELNNARSSRRHCGRALTTTYALPTALPIRIAAPSPRHSAFPISETCAQTILGPSQQSPFAGWSVALRLPRAAAMGRSIFYLRFSEIFPSLRHVAPQTQRKDCACREFLCFDRPLKPRSGRAIVFRVSIVRLGNCQHLVSGCLRAQARWRWPSKKL